ncbi:uncharacterized protein LOC108862335 isoform X2 [Raphanus sativus]|uniref:Uncharacterized protein LOC108862335 isoform X2 n=1 Tax=Raphanus sativus TaxID=3726 RepID=A0A9W3DUD6_RAPSA|nr:uncharacterized protein LOC108862335 isoform X2 [Raphanus sativus]
MVLRADPHSLTRLLSMLRWRPRYRGEDKLPLIVWMMSHAFQQDLPAALHSWAVNLLPLVFSKKCSYSSQSIHLILQFVEMILSSNQEARDVFLNEPVRPSGMRLIPPHSFEMLLLLACPARVEEATTERFQAIYPLLKEVALAPDSRSAGELKHIFAFSLKFAGLKASEATAIAFSLLTQNVDCFMQWDVLYKEYLEASVALLKKLVDERWWIPKLLSSSPTDNLIFEHAMNSFMMKNEIAAIIEEVANLSLYQEADYLCKLLSYLNKSNLNAAKMDPSDLKLVEDKSYGVSAAEEIEKAIVSLSLSEAAKKMDPSPLAAKMDPSDLKTNHTVLVQLRKLKRR